MAKQSRKNPFVHERDLSDGRHMLNSAGYDGWSYDEYDDDDDNDMDEHIETTSVRYRQAADYLNLSVADAVNMTDKELCDSYDEFYVE